MFVATIEFEQIYKYTSNSTRLQSNAERITKVLPVGNMDGIIFEETRAIYEG